jgi:hypothetical protein
MNHPDISIIVATRNREQILWETVQKACDIIENKNAEIIVVSDDDTTLDIPGSLAGKIHYFDNPKKGVSSARIFWNTECKGMYSLFLLMMICGSIEKYIEWDNILTCKKKLILMRFIISIGNIRLLVEQNK